MRAHPTRIVAGRLERRCVVPGRRRAHAPGGRCDPGCDPDGHRGERRGGGQAERADLPSGARARRGREAPRDRRPPRHGHRGGAAPGMGLRARPHGHLRGGRHVDGERSAHLRRGAPESARGSRVTERTGGCHRYAGREPSPQGGPTMTRVDDMRKALEATIGNLTPARAQELAKGFLEPGAAKEQVAKTAADMMEWSQRNRLRLRSAIQDEIKDQMRQMGVATQDELDALRKRVRELERGAGMTASGRRRAAAKTTSAKRASSTKTAAKKTSTSGNA